MNNNYKHLDIVEKHYDEVICILDEHSEYLKKMGDKIYRKKYDEEIAAFFEGASTSVSTATISGVFSFPEQYPDY